MIESDALQINLPGPSGEEDQPPGAFFEKIHHIFQKIADRAGGTTDRFYTIGGRIVCLRFAGAALAACFTPALDHLTTDPVSAPDLTVCFWDSDSTGQLLPSTPWSADDYGPQGEIHLYNTSRFYMVYQLGFDALHMVDRSRNLAIYWTESTQRVPYWERSFPLRIILHGWLRHQPFQLIHAGAVGRPEGGVLIAGKSGSGKSTTTLSCLDSALLWAGDDYVLVQLDPEPYVYSLYGTAKLENDNMYRFPDLHPAISNPHRLEKEKALIYLNRHYPAKMIRGFPIRAILLPRISGNRDTRIFKAGPMAGLAAMAPTTILHLPAGGQAALQKMSRLAKEVPTYILEAGTDLAQIPAAIAGLLAQGAL
ncbi:MAG: serine kinase [Chloroflexi bacterium]|nr:serine kinase [Chloroflexota bacterium]